MKRVYITATAVAFICMGAAAVSMIVIGTTNSSSTIQDDARSGTDSTSNKDSSITGTLDSTTTNSDPAMDHQNSTAPAILPSRPSTSPTTPETVQRSFLTSAPTLTKTIQPSPSYVPTESFLRVRNDTEAPVPSLFPSSSSPSRIYEEGMNQSDILPFEINTTVSSPTVVNSSLPRIPSYFPSDQPILSDVPTTLLMDNNETMRSPLPGVPSSPTSTAATTSQVLKLSPFPTTSNATIYPTLTSKPSPSNTPSDHSSSITSTPMTPVTSITTSPSYLTTSFRKTTLPPTTVYERCSHTIFYAIADVPYSSVELEELPHQIENLPEDAEFLIHLGDIRSAADGDPCRWSDYQRVATMLQASRVPVFVVVGDNEWNDCPNREIAWGFWEEWLLQLEDSWDHPLQVQRQTGRRENFAFVHKGTLFIGLNLVGGRVHNVTEWSDRLEAQMNWVKHLVNTEAAAKSVVIMGHANPTSAHAKFFNPLKEYIRDVLSPKRIPVLYLNGDAHVWNYEPNYMGQEEFLRIQLTGGTSEPILQIMVSHLTDGMYDNGSNLAEQVFLYDRRL